MALTKCPECKGDVSSLADKCIHCGCPLTTNTAVSQPASVQTIELTGKKYKKQMVVSVQLISLGVIILILAVILASRISSIIFDLSRAAGIGLALIGIVWLSRVRFLIWWHHR